MSKTTFSELLDTSKPVLIDFYADWCGPCQMMQDVIEKLQAEMGDQIRVVQIDADQNQPLLQKLNIRSLPTFLIFQNGELKWQGVGMQTLRGLKETLEKLVVDEE